MKEAYFRGLDEQFERTGARRPSSRYWHHITHELMCPYCDAPVVAAHPAEALDVCPVYESARCGVT